jgi:hypothetical protein
MEESKIVTQQGTDGRTYKVINDTWFDVRTPDEVIHLLELARRLNYYVWFRLGDPATGEDWMDCYAVCGFVGRSMGPIKIPILLRSRRSIGGGGMLTDSIVRLVVHRAGSRGVVPFNRQWQAATYKTPELFVDYVLNYSDNRRTWVVKDKTANTIHGHFKSIVQAKRYIDFITGRRLNP